MSRTALFSSTIGDVLADIPLSAVNQGAQVVKNTAGVLTAANLRAGIIASTPAGAINLQLPTAAAMDAEFTELGVDQGLEFSVISLAGSTNLPTITTNTGWTLVGSMAFTAVAGNAGRFLARKTADGAWTLYRIA